MARSIYVLATLASLAMGSPAPKPSEQISPRQISIPGSLIPLIPGVTEPLSSNAPPLPILQVPTTPLDSPPFTGSNIQPKKISVLLHWRWRQRACWYVIFCSEFSCLLMVLDFLATVVGKGAGQVI